jgi:hypothetical protein
MMKTYTDHHMDDYLLRASKKIHKILSPVMIFMIFTCCVDITTDRQVVAASFLNQGLWYGMLTDLMGLQILAENGVGISILCSSLYSWTPSKSMQTRAPTSHSPHSTNFCVAATYYHSYSCNNTQNCNMACSAYII